MIINKISGIGQRSKNEDFILTDNLSASRVKLCLVADGMGGYEYGDQAAKITAESLHTFLSLQTEFNADIIQIAVNKANLAVKQFNERKGSKSGATIGGVIINENLAHLFWVGDVRIFCYENEELKFQSRSHNFINKLQDEGELIPEPLIDRYRHIVTHAVMGEKRKAQIGYSTYEVSSHSSIIVCSDGVHNLVNPSCALIRWNLPIGGGLIFFELRFVYYRFYFGVWMMF